MLTVLMSVSLFKGDLCVRLALMLNNLVHIPRLDIAMNAFGR